MRITRKKLRSAATAIFMGLLLLVVAPVGSEYFIELAREQGLYDNPSKRVASMTEWLAAVSESWWLALALGFFGGATLVFWFGEWLPRREARAAGPNVASDSSSANRSAEEIRAEVKLAREKNRAKESDKPEKPKRDVWLIDAIYYIATGKWDAADSPELPDTAEVLRSIFRAANDVRQAAYDSDLPVWGRSGFSGPLVEIPREYWEDWGFEEGDILRANKEDFCTSLVSKAFSKWGSSYKHLKTSKSMTEQLFRQDTIHPKA